MVGACPKCRTVRLLPVSGQLDLRELAEAACECPSCGGYWLPHAVREVGLGRPSLILPEDGSPPSRMPEADHRTGLCPEGHGILIRARVEENPPFHLERCATCRGVWLDRGERHRLASAGLWSHLDDLWDPSWRKRARVQEGQRKLDVALELALGKAVFEELERVVLDLRTHPARAQALAWITAHLERLNSDQ